MADLAGVLFGHDVSHHQEGVDVGQLAGVFIIARTAQAAGGQYGTTIDRMYATHKANARRAGKLFGAYFYLGSSLSAASNAALHESIEPDRSIPVMLDWETGSGNVAFLRSCAAAFESLGYNVFLTYAPQWYLNGAGGGGSLAGLPPLCSSKYPDMNPDDIISEYIDESESAWNGYGGNTVLVLQFTSSGRDAAYPTVNLDTLAYKGTMAQLAALFGVAGGGSSSGGDSDDLEDEDVSSDEIIGTGTGDDQEFQQLLVPVNGHQYLRIAIGWGDTAILGGISLVDDTPGPTGSHVVTVQQGGIASPDRPGPWNLYGAGGANFGNYSHVAILAKAPAGSKVRAWVNDRP